MDATPSLSTNVCEPACSQCGYSLLGLPNAGRCPECALAYGPDTLTLWGTAGETLRGEKIARNLQLGWAAVVFVLFLFLSWRRGIAMGLEALQALAPAAVWLAMVLWLLYVDKRRRQVRLSLEGFAARLGPGTARIRPWHGDEELDLRHVGPDTYLFTIRQNLSVPVQMNVPCPDADVERLRTHIESIIHRKVGLER